MVATPNFDLDIDTTLGGNNASDYVIPSQKAIKSYVDNNSGGGGTVDQTYDATSANAQSGVAIAGAKFLQNEATNSGSSVIVQGTTKNSRYAIGIGLNNSVAENGVGIGLAATTTNSNSTSIGANSRARGQQATALGSGAMADASSTLAVGSSAGASVSNAIAVGLSSLASSSYATALGSGATAGGNYAIQIGYGTNNTANTLNVGFWNAANTHYNWQLLDGTTGLIPDARISSNIARTSAIPTVPTNISAFTNDSGYITGITSSDVTTALGYTPYNSTNPSGYITSSAQSQYLQAYDTAEKRLAVGLFAQANANGSTALGWGANTDTSATNAIQIGQGTNSTASSLQIGFGTNNNYTLLDGTTGLIPDARISTNIARTSAIPTVPTNVSAFTNDSGYITGITSSDVTTALTYTPADTDLSNLSTTGQKVIDGQWVNNSVTLANGVSMTSSSQDYSLSNYLPNDNYDYEVMFNCNITSGSSTGNRIFLAVTTDISSYTEMAYAIPRSNATVTAYGFCILPVGSGRKVTVAGNTTPKGTYQLSVRGYRRIGTNT